MDFPDYRKGEMVKIKRFSEYFDPEPSLGLVIEPSPHGASGFVKVLVQWHGTIDHIPYSSLEKIPTD